MRLAVLLVLFGLAVALAVTVPADGRRRSGAAAHPGTTVALRGTPVPQRETTVPLRETTVPRTTTTKAPAAVPTADDPGSLPQTAAFPSASSPQFLSEMSELWRGVVTGSSRSAIPAFFPEAAYLQLKDIYDARSDYANRLLYDYSLDVGAAHLLLGAAAARASLVDVVVPSQYGHWVPPGACSNSVGYFEVANSRVVYQEGGQVRSFGIASLISWRGTWYVVHLGAILRSSQEGVVEDPEVGTGYSSDSSTC